jgi:hypothetical protein
MVMVLFMIEKATELPVLCEIERRITRLKISQMNVFRTLRDVTEQFSSLDAFIVLIYIFFFARQVQVLYLEID